MSAMPARILAIEDHAANLYLLKLLLEQDGHEVGMATTLDQATAMLACTTFDLVLTDSFSPTPTGVFADTAALRQAAGSTPVVLLSAHRIDQASARAAGFVGVVGKPYDIDDLLTQVREALSAAANF